MIYRKTFAAQRLAAGGLRVAARFARRRPEAMRDLLVMATAELDAWLATVIAAETANERREAAAEAARVAAEQKKGGPR